MEVTSGTQVWPPARSLLALRAIRERHKLTQAGLALASGVSRRQIIRIEAGTCEPTHATAELLAISLGYTIDDLQNVEDPDVTRASEASTATQDGRDALQPV
jgi:transcriptional regulator with XRE-family HTH domain